MTDTNPHLGTAPTEWGPRDAPLAVLALHGRGQSPDRIGDLRTRIGDEALRWIAPAAAEHSWYPFRFMEEPPREDRWLPWALESVEERLAAMSRDGFPLDRIVLLGFSQGACLLSQHALMHPTRFAGLILLTGGYIGVAGADPGFSGDFAGTPALLATREDDDWVPLSRVRETEKRLRALGAEVTALVEPAGEHEISETAALLVGRFVADLVRRG